MILMFGPWKFYTLIKSSQINKYLTFSLIFKVILLSIRFNTLNDKNPIDLL